MHSKHPHIAPLLALTVLLASPFAGAQQVWYVSASASPGGNGQSWGTAFSTLQPGLAVAGPDDEIWVAAGSYQGGFVVPAGVKVYGGLRSGAVTRWDRSPGASILDGQNAQRVLVLSSGCVVDGFSVVNGHATGLGGGAALIDGTDPVIRNCWFTGHANSSGRGRVLCVRGGAHPIVSNCFFFDNDQGPGGHAIDLVNAHGIWSHIVVYGNASNGFHFQADSDPIIRNSVFANNGGRGLCDITTDDDPILENNLLWGNGVSLYHYHGSEFHTIAGVNGLGYAQGNISADPEFASWGLGELRLTPTSPCIDAGTLAGVQDATDAFGGSRLTDGDLDGSLLADIGGHEHSPVQLQLTGTFAHGGTVQLDVAGTGGFQITPVAASGAVPGVLYPSIGYAFLDLASTVIVLPTGSAPFAFQTVIPSTWPVGVPLYIQAIGVAPGGSAHLSQMAVLTIQ